MIEKCTIRPARPEEATGIVEILRSTFPSELVNMTIYACSGIVNFVTNAIAVQDFGGERHYTIALKDNMLVGCVEMRRFYDALFLNYVTVHPSFRSNGIARQLLDAAIHFTGRENIIKLILDVYEPNRFAMQWYKRLGFQQTGIIRWWTLPLMPGPTGMAQLSGYAMSDACQSVYGFSQFRVLSGNRQWDIGRLGTEWFRLKSNESLVAPGVTNLLAQLDAKRRILLIDQNGCPPQKFPKIQKAAVFHRLHMPLEELLSKLTFNISKSLECAYTNNLTTNAAVTK